MTDSTLIQHISRCKNPKQLSTIIRQDMGTNFSASEDVVDALVRKSFDFLPSMTNSNISGLLSAIANINVSRDAGRAYQELMKTLGEEALRKLHYFTARDISVTLNAFAKKYIRYDELFESLGEEAISIIHDFAPQGLANTVNAFAKLNYRNSVLFDEVARNAIPIIDKFNAQALSNTVNAFAKINHKHPELFDMVADASLLILHEFNGQNLSNTVNAFAKMEHHHYLLFGSVAKAAIPIIHTFNAQELANMVNAFSKMEHQHPRLFEKVAEVSISKIHKFNTQNLSNLVNAFAKMGHRHPRLFDEVARASLPIIWKFNAQELSNTVNAFAKIDHRHPQLFEKVAETAIPILRGFTSQGLANLVSAFARIGPRNELDKHLFSEVEELVIARERSLYKWKDQSLVEVVYAFMKAGRNSRRFLNVIGREIINRGHRLSFDARQLGNLAAAFSKYETPSSASVLMIIFEKFQRFDHREISLQSVVDVSSAISIGLLLQVIPHGFTEEVINLAIAKSNESRPEDVKDVLLNFARVELDEKFREELVKTYEPIFLKHSREISAGICEKIAKLYNLGSRKKVYGRKCTWSMNEPLSSKLRKTNSFVQT